MKYDNCTFVGGIFVWYDMMFLHALRRTFCAFLDVFSLKFLSDTYHTKKKKKKKKTFFFLPDG